MKPSGLREHLIDSGTEAAAAAAPAVTNMPLRAILSYLFGW